jgi:hypothetical protein
MNSLIENVAVQYNISDGNCIGVETPISAGNYT